MAASNKYSAAGYLIGQLENPYAPIDTGIATAMDRQTKAKAEERASLLFSQQQDDRTRLLGERAASQAFQKTMSEDPFEKAGWVTDAAAASKNAGLLSRGELYGDLNAYEAAVKNKTVLPDLYGDEAKTTKLLPEQVATRLAFQQHPVEMLKSVVGDELRTQQMSRALDDAGRASLEFLPSNASAAERAGGYLGSDLYKAKENAKALEIQATTAERTRLQGDIAAIDKTFNDYEKTAMEQGIKGYDLKEKTTDHSVTVAPLSEAALSKTYTNKSGKSMSAAAASLETVQLIRDNVSVGGWSLPFSDAADVNNKVTAARKAGYSPEAIASALFNSMDITGGGSNIDDKMFLDNLEKSGKAGGGGGPSGGGTGTTTKDGKKGTDREVRFVGANEFLLAKSIERDKQKAIRQKELNNLDMSPAERQAAKMQDAVDKWLGMLTPTEKAKVDTPAAVLKSASATEVKGASTKVLPAPADKDKAPTTGDSTKKDTAPSAPKSKVEERAKSAAILMAPKYTEQQLAKLEGGKDQNAGDLILDPLGWIGGGAKIAGKGMDLVNKYLPKPGQILADGLANVTNSKIVTKGLNAIGMWSPKQHQGRQALLNQKANEAVATGKEWVKDFPAQKQIFQGPGRNGATGPTTDSSALLRRDPNKPKVDLRAMKKADLKADIDSPAYARKDMKLGKINDEATIKFNGLDPTKVYEVKDIKKVVEDMLLNPSKYRDSIPKAQFIANNSNAINQIARGMKRKK